VTGKIEIIIQAGKANVPVISCMGTGNKLDPTVFKVADIYSTKVCPLAKRMRKLCKDNGIEKLKVVYSEEEPIIPLIAEDDDNIDESRRSVPGSNAFVPAVAGLIIAGEVIKDLIKLKGAANERKRSV
jgi:tRNA A37 threonylcarbamoyladenosine dehydratase